MRKRVGSAALFVALHLLMGVALHGQNGEGGEAESHWLASAHYLRYSLPDQADWWSTSLSGGHATAMRTVILELERSERAGFEEFTFGADVYQTLSSQSYVNVRARTSPDAETVPQLLAAIDVIHGLGAPWEAWIGYEYRKYPLETVQTVGFGPGRYIGTWYVRTRPTVSLAGGEATLLGRVLARRFFEDSPDNYLELGAGYGHEFVEILPTAGGRIETRAEETWMVSGRTQIYLNPILGLTLGAVYQSYRFLGARPNFNAGILGRF